MKLSFDQIKSVAVGAIRVWEENGAVRFSKGTQKQIDAWYALEQVLGERAETTTGVHLDLHTNSSRFAFTAVKGGKYEIYVNNILMYNITANDLADGRYEIELDKASSEENRVTLILPSHEVGILSSVEIDDGATLSPHEFDRKFLFIGDSITQGWDSGYDSLSYAYRVSRFFNAESVIYGIGGGFFHDSVLDDAVDFDPDTVFVAFGTNDWGKYRSFEELRDNTVKFLDKLVKKYGEKTIIGISPIWRDDTNQTKGTGSFEDVCALVKEQLAAHGAIVIDGATLTPHLREFFADGFLHPNALGFGIYAESLASAVLNVIK